MKTISHPLELTNQITERGLMVFDNVSKMPIYDKPFTSPFIVICLNHKGWLKTNFDMQIVEFHAHDIAIILPGHIILAQESSADFHASTLIVSPHFLDKLNHSRHHFTINPLEYHYNSAFHLNDKQYEGILGVFHMLKAISQLNHPDREEMLANQMELGTELMKIYLHENGIMSTQEFTASQQLLNRFLNTVVKHFRDSREVQYYAKQLCLSPKYFGSVIKQQTGIEANEWISRYVIIQAKTLLRHRKDLNIQQVSYQLGFNDPAAFTRYFKANVGLSPKEYRMQHE